MYLPIHRLLNKNSFILYTEYDEKLSTLTDEQFGRLMRAIFQHERSGEISIDLDAVTQVAFAFIAGDLDRAREKWEQSIKNGKKGGRPKTQANPNKPNRNLSKPKPNLNEDVNVNEDVNEADILPFYPEESDHDLNNLFAEESSESLEVQMASGAGEPVDHSTTLIEQGFDLFWSAYPKRKSKQDAIKAWNNIKPSAELIETMLQAIAAQKKTGQWIDSQGKYIPYPASWLNGKMWNDELEVSTHDQWDDLNY